MSAPSYARLMIKMPVFIEISIIIAYHQRISPLGTPRRWLNTPGSREPLIQHTTSLQFTDLLQQTLPECTRRNDTTRTRMPENKAFPISNIPKSCKLRRDLYILSFAFDINQTEKSDCRSYISITPTDGTLPLVDVPSCS